MIIYNVTLSVDPDIADEWMHWMRTSHIPDVMSTGQFLEYRILRVVTGDHSALTFAVQYTCESHEVLENYQTRYAPELQKAFFERYGDRAVAFRSVLELL